MHPHSYYFGVKSTGLSHLSAFVLTRCLVCNSHHAFCCLLAVGCSMTSHITHLLHAYVSNARQEGHIVVHVVSGRGVRTMARGEKSLHLTTPSKCLALRLGRPLSSWAHRPHYSCMYIPGCACRQGFEHEQASSCSTTTSDFTFSNS